MDFRDYWYAMAKDQRGMFAAACDSTEGYLNLVASKHARAGESLALKIERESHGQVTVEELRPDVPWDVVRGKAPPRGGSHGKAA